MPRLRTVTLLFGDIASFLAALGLALLIRYGGHPDQAIIALYAFATPFLVAMWLGGFLVFGLYDARGARNRPEFFDRLGRALVLNFAVTILLFYLARGFGLRPLGTLVIIFTALGILLASWRGIFNSIVARRAKERVFFYGIANEVRELAAFLLENPQLGFLPVAFAAANGEPMPEPMGNALAYPSGNDLARAIGESRADIVVIAHTTAKTKELVRSLFSVLPLGIRIEEFPKFYEAVQGKVPVSLIGEAWFIENLVGMRRPRYEFAKRMLDLVLALASGFIGLLLLPAIAAAIVLSTPRDIMRFRERRARLGDGIIFFRQPRVGRGGKIFRFLKFRSQVLGAEQMGSEKTGDADPRAYPVGTLLRKTYLDEVPQLWNVIRGEMSFVGPRPERPEFVEKLERIVPFYRMRELVLPGITGWAQVNMENDASVSDAPQKIQYDLYYIKRRSLALDLLILAKTALALLRRSGR